VKKVNLTLTLIVLMGLFMTVLPGLQVNAASARQRSFSEWLAAQGTFVNPANCASLVTGWLTRDLATFARADYSGKICDCITANGGPTFNPSFSGTVTERDLPDGTVEIQVVHHFTNTHVVARDQTLPTPPGAPAPAIIGYNAGELFGHPDLQSAVASGTLQAKFILPHPDFPLPNLAEVSTLSISIRFQGSGPLREAFGVTEGTPGKVIVNQTGLFDIPGHGNGVADGFPVESINVFRVGN
jgi:hypothetical protein